MSVAEVIDKAERSFNRSSCLHMNPHVIIIIVSCSLLLTSIIIFFSFSPHHHRHRQRVLEPPELPDHVQNTEHEFHPLNASSWNTSYPVAPSSKPQRILSRRKRDMPCKKGKRLNSYVDNLFRYAANVITGQLPMSLENITIDLPEYNVLIFLYNGMLTQIDGVERKGKAWVYCQNDTLFDIRSIGLPTKVSDIRVTYKYRFIKDWRLVYDGDAEIQALKVKTQLQITQYRPKLFELNPQQRLDSARIWSIGMVRVMLRGLGNLTSALSMILTSWLNNNLDYLFPMVKDRVENVLVVRMNSFLVGQTLPFETIEPNE